MPYKNPEKQKSAKADWYKKNKALSDQRTEQTRRKRLDKINSLKESSPCTDCGNFYHYSQMQYDHVSGSKVMGIGAMIRSRSFEAVLKEIEKCELVCANCHSFRTWKRHQE